MATSAVEPGYSGRTAWARNLQTPLRKFLRTETGSAAVLRRPPSLAALLWVNVDARLVRPGLGARTLSIRSATHGALADLRDWVNSGLMTFFFFVVGLEARREFDMGELRERAPHRAAAARRHRRHGRAGRDLSSPSTPASSSAQRLGRRDVDRHGVRARRCSRSSAARVPGPAARLPADGRRRRRHRRARS